MKHSEPASIAAPNLVGHPLPITDQISIATSELHWHFDKASDEHQRVELEFQPGLSESIDFDSRQIILDHLKHKLTDKGVLQISASEHASQHENRHAALERLQHILRDALHSVPSRVAEKVPAAYKEERIEEKHHHAEIKAARQGHGDV
jgi:ribosome-associated protein